MSSQNPPPPLSSFLLSWVYVLNRLWDSSPSRPPYRDDIVYGWPLIVVMFNDALILNANYQDIFLFQFQQKTCAIV